mgnify:CR=1 FL=1
MALKAKQVSFFVKGERISRTMVKTGSGNSGEKEVHRNKVCKICAITIEEIQV